MITNNVTEFRENGEIEATCHACRASLTAPDKGLGRAVIAAFRTQHQHRA